MSSNTNQAKTSMSDYESKIIERVRKLLALADAKSGATEAEASSAAEKAAAIMAEHGLEQAAVVAGGGQGEERTKRQSGQGKAAFNWQPPLMRAICESFFVDCGEIFKTLHSANGRRTRTGYSLIGRKSNVVSAEIMFDYLCAAVERVTRDAAPAQPKFYRIGVADRLALRIRQRHAERLAEQAKEAQERRAAAEARGDATNALVLVLSDYADDEVDRNRDVRYNLEPGTSARKRQEAVTLEQARKTRLADLKAQGIDAGVAENMAYFDMNRERAEEYEAEWLKRNARSRSRGGRTDHVRSSGSYWQGHEDGKSIGLEPQVGKK